jgi:6-phosphofructokinase 1
MDNEEGHTVKKFSLTKKRIQLLRKVSRKFDDGLINYGDIAISRVPHLAESHDCDAHVNPMHGDPSKRDQIGGEETGRGFLPDQAFSSVKKFVLFGKSYTSYQEIARELKFLRAGPRRQIFFKPEAVKAAIVTCGGLCPGMNVVIREIVMCLWFNYGVKDIYGVKYGFRGFHNSDDIIKLEPKLVDSIHNEGGTFLGSSRGGFDAKVIIDMCKEKGINQLYIVGGDGTHRAIYALYEYATAQNEMISICGIPKTIDNDIPIIDRSFGFNSACAAAEEIIECVNVEANSAQYGVGLVKVMGRDSGEIAAMSTLASRDVNICLIPESPFELEGEFGLYEAVCRRLLRKGHCTIVVAEGADDAIIDDSLIKDDTVDAGGHTKHADIGVFLKDKIVAYGKEKHGIEITLKYIDPTYTIRSVPANAGDTIMCTKLAQNVVHGAMAGYTGFSIGHVKDVDAIIPIKCINEFGVRRIDIFERTWQRVLASTGQPQMVKPENMKLIYEKYEEEHKIAKEKHEALILDQIRMSAVILEDFSKSSSVQDLVSESASDSELP